MPESLRTSQGMAANIDAQDCAADLLHYRRDLCTDWRRAAVGQRTGVGVYDQLHKLRVQRAQYDICGYSI